MLKRLFTPSAIAIIGASDDIRRPGGYPLHALTTYGYKGVVCPVNPRRAEINGRPCFPTVQALPCPCDLAIIGVPAAGVPAALEDCGSAGIPFAIVLSAGFKEIGEKGRPLQAQLDAAILSSSVRVVGPNCLGVLALPQRMYAGFGALFRNPDWPRGPLAMISQSGGFAYSILSSCREAGLGFDYVVSTGNESSLGMLDFVEHFLEDDGVRLIALYVEGLRDGRRLRALGRRALAARKPIAVWKVGNTAAGSRAAVSHTANLTEDYDFYRDAFAEGGFVEVREIYDLIDAARAFRVRHLPRGRRVAVVTTSGGAGVLLADRCEEAGLPLPALTPETRAKLGALVPDFASLANPVDLTAALAQTEEPFTAAMRHTIEDAYVDLAILRSYPGRDVQAWTDHLAAYAATCTKPILVSLSGTQRQSAEWAPRLDEAGVPCFETPSGAVAAAAMLCAFAGKVERAARTREPARVAPHVALERPANASALGENDAKAWLQSYGITTPRRMFLALDARPGESDLPFPAVVKIVSPDIPHKTEAGGVRVGVQRAGLERTLAEVRENAIRYRPDARIEGWLVEEQVEGVELIVGALANPAFGPLVLVGMGGVHAEISRDVARRYAPVDVDAAREMVLSLRAARLLTGYRGAPPCDIDALCEVISRLSWMIADHEASVTEVEINPLIVGPAGRGALAADAIVRFKNSV
jgi:acyl-CoA synthetase (NDP forming)